MKHARPISPCVHRCTLSDTDVCLGCGRTLDEIKRWTKLSETEKAQIMARVQNQPIP